MDLVELGRLVGLVGPYGVKIIEKKLIRWLVSSVKDIEVRDVPRVSFALFHFEKFL